MRPVYLDAISVMASPEEKINWCVKAIQQIARASHDNDPNVYADGFTFSNVTETRTLDADSTTLAEVADVLATWIGDHKTRGAKRTT